MSIIGSIFTAITTVVTFAMYLMKKNSNSEQSLDSQIDQEVAKERQLAEEKGRPQ